MNETRIVFLVLTALASGCQVSSPSTQAIEVAAKASDRRVSTDAQSTSVGLAQQLQSDKSPSKKGAIAGGSICASDEVVLFSCKIEGSEKVASLCASKDVSDERGHLYYAYGTSQGKEMVFPEGDQPPAKLFKRTQLGFSGNTGGYAYSFEVGSYKYIIYSASGANGFEDQGIMVTRDNAHKPEVSMSCEQDSVVEDEDEKVLDMVLGWDHDAVIESRGLPTRN